MSFRPIILAEDHSKLRRMYADLLEVSGFKVMLASDGEKAVGLLRKVVNPQLIILDVMMPKLSGLEACIQMREMLDHKPCPILFLTALDDPDDVLNCLRAGGDDFLMKSAPLDEILARVLLWAQRGASDEACARRHKAIEALEQITDQSHAGEQSSAIAGVDASAK